MSHSLGVVRREGDLVEVPRTIRPKLALSVPEVLVESENVISELSVTCWVAGQHKLAFESLAEPSVEVGSEGSVVEARHVGPVRELDHVPIHRVAVHHAKRTEGLLGGVRPMSVAEHVVELSHKGVPISDDWQERILDQEIAEPFGRGARQESRRIEDAALLVGECVRMLHKNDH